MEPTPCSKMWTDLNINIPRKQIRYCCKRLFQDVSLDEIRLLGPNVFQQNNTIVYERKITLEENKLGPGCIECTKTWPNSYWNIWNQWKRVTNLKDVIQKTSVELIEIALSSTCNMTCMYCQPDVSNQWNKLLNIPYYDDLIYKKELLDALYEYIEKEIVSKGKEIRYDFVGGEPLLDLDVFTVIQNLLKIHASNKNKKIGIEIVTNLNVKPIIVDRLNEFMHNHPYVNWVIKISIDSIGTIGKEIRDGLDLERWENNLHKLIKNNACTIKFLPTISNVNLGTLNELFLYLIRIFREYDMLKKYGTKWTLSQNLVSNPKGMFIGTLPEKYKDTIDECILTLNDNLPNCRSKSLNIEYLKSLKLLINTKREYADKDEVNRFFKRQGKLKNKNYFEIFPALKDINE